MLRAAQVKETVCAKALVNKISLWFHFASLHVQICKRMEIHREISELFSTGS